MNQLTILDTALAPTLIVAAGDRAAYRFLEFFADGLPRMSMSKRYLFDPEFVPQRQAEAEAAINAFPYRLPARRKNKVSASPRWDPLWEDAISSAAGKLGVEHIRVNDGICFRLAADRDRVLERAEVLWRERHDHYAAQRGSRA